MQVLLDEVFNPKLSDGCASDAAVAIHGANLTTRLHASPELLVHLAAADGPRCLPAPRSSSTRDSGSAPTEPGGPGEPDGPGATGVAGAGGVAPADTADGADPLENKTPSFAPSTDAWSLGA